jgi:hypothetical protein
MGATPEHHPIWVKHLNPHLPAFCASYNKTKIFQKLFASLAFRALL